jgi:polar amino acid transport system ATP-binding protein
LIEIENVHKSFGALEVLKGISMTVAKGEVVSVIGGSGSGKSTLLMCVNGLEPIQSGRILVDGTEVHARATDLNQLRRKIGIVFQQLNAFPHLTVRENVMLAPRKVLGKSRDERLAIARALAMSPDYMLLDEVTSALDPQLVGEVLDTLRMLSGEGMTMIVVTHEIAFAREVSNRVAFFKDGRIHEIGPPEQVIGNPREPETIQFMKSVLSNTARTST